MSGPDVMLPPPMPQPARGGPPGPRLLPSLAVIGIGLVIGFVAVVAIVIPLLGTFTSPSYSVPGDLRLHLHHAKYTVYQHTGTRSAFGSAKDDQSVIRIAPQAVSIRAIDGTVVPVDLDSSQETLTRGTNVYTGSLDFDVPSDGEYDLTFTNARPTTVVVARSLTDAVRSAVIWFVVGAVGGAILVGGVVMWIVGVTRRGRAKRAMYPGWGPPPGSGPPWPGQCPPPSYPPPSAPPGD